jgi:N-acyl amino acid synthase of PEP-CTERM/exosortase system
VENPFENPEDFPDGLEGDAFDDRSVHSLLVHRETLTPAGTVRMVFPESGADNGHLPLDYVCTDPVIYDNSRLPRQNLVEISRFAVAKRFRLRHQSSLNANRCKSRALNDRVPDRRVIPHLCLGLIEALVDNSARRGVTHWCAAMEPSLLRLLSRLGIHFHPLGAIVDHHGLRQPCYTEVDSMLRRTKRERPDVWALITDNGRLWPESAAGSMTSNSTPHQSLERRAI